MDSVVSDRFLRTDRRDTIVEAVTATQFEADLNDAWTRASPSSKPRYTKLTCWLIYWRSSFDGNEVNVRDDVVQMDALMRGRFGAVTKHHVLNERDSVNTRVNKNILDFCNPVNASSGSDELHIIYYTGHAEIDKQKREVSWFPLHAG